MDSEEAEHGQDSEEEMVADYDYHVNTKEWPELFDDESVGAYIANLNDWD